MRTYIGWNAGMATPSLTLGHGVGLVHDAGNHVLLTTAIMPSAQSSQTTQYVMGVGTTGGLFSNNLVGAVRYPDKTTGRPSSAAADDQIYTYNNLSQKLTFTDHFAGTTSPGGSVHDYGYNVLGRMTLDGIPLVGGVASVGSGVDKTVLSHAWTFDGAGHEFQASSYGTSDGTGTPVNQNEYIYNGFSQLVTEYEARTGAVNTGSSPFIGWTYNVPSSSANNDRQLTMTSPNGCVEDYGYGGQTDVSSITYSGTTATATTNSPHGLLPGSQVYISGASPSQYDGTFTVASVTDATHFTYTMSASPGANASGSVMMQTGTANVPVATITFSGTTATLTPAGGTNLIALAAGTQFQIVVSGATPAVYDGTFTATVVAVGSVNLLTYTLSATPTLNASGADMVMSSPTLTLDEAISRVSMLQDYAGLSAGMAVEAYSYLGLDTIVVKNRPEDHTQLTYIKVTGDSSYHDDGGDGRYTGLDRFGSVIDQYWLNTGTGGGAVDRLQYGYDRDRNVLYINNLVNPASSELFHANGAGNGYDDLNRLPAFERGTLNSTNDTIATPSTNQTYNLDAVGNFNSITDGSLSQTRTATSQNQVNTISGTSLGGGTAYQPLYDNAGNTLRNDTGNYLVYDGWNMVVTVKDTSDSTTLNSFTHDAGGQVATSGGGTNPAEWFYTPSGRLVETWYPVSGIYNQYVWGEGYVNALILRDRNKDGSLTTGNYGINGSGLEERLYANQDPDYDVTTLVAPASGSQTVELRFLYDAWGKPITVDPTNWTATSDPGYYMRILWQGEYWENNSSSYMMGARFYSYTMGTWFQKDPTGYLDGSNSYEIEHDSPASGRDPLGLYDEAGHYWTTYAVALMAGMSPERARQLAYWSQYSDLDPRYGAVSALRIWTMDRAGRIQDNLHSLTGGSPCRRRCVLRTILRTQQLSTPQRGLIIHALGDAYAHTWFDWFGGEHGFGAPFGHALAGHAPDHIGTDPGKYQNYVGSLYSAPGGAPNNPDLQAFLASVPSNPACCIFQDNGIPRDEAQWGHDQVQALLGHDPGGVPKLDPNTALSPKEVNGLMKLIEDTAKGGCCK